MNKIEFTLLAVQTNSEHDIMQTYDCMLDVSRAFISELGYLEEMQAFRGGTITAHGMQIKYVRDDGWTRRVWVEIDAPQEF